LKTKLSPASKIFPYLVVRSYSNVLYSIERVPLKFTATSPHLFVPAASMFAAIRRLENRYVVINNPSMEMIREFKEFSDIHIGEKPANLVIGVADKALVYAALPNLKDVYLSERVLSKARSGTSAEDIVGIVEKYTGEKLEVSENSIVVPMLVGEYASKFGYESILRKDIILTAGKVLGGIMKHTFGIKAYPGKSIDTVIFIESEKARVAKRLRINLYEINGHLYPGIVSYIISNIERFAHPKYLEVAKDIVKEIADIGRKVAATSENFLQHAGLMTFDYIVAKFQEKQSGKKSREDKGFYKYLGNTGVPHCGLQLYARREPKTDIGYVYLRVSIYPQNPPSSLAYNLAPLNLAPLIAVVNANSSKLRTFIGKRLQRFEEEERVEIVDDWHDSLISCLSDVKLTTRDIWESTKYGYAETYKILDIAHKLEKLEGLSDLLYLALYNKAYKVDTKLLDSLLKSLGIEEESRTYKERQSTHTAGEKEEEMELLL